MRLEPTVDLGGVDVCDTLGEVARQHAEPRPHLEHDVVRLESCEPADHAENVLVDEEVLPEVLTRRDGHSPNTRFAFSSICAARASRLAPRICASASYVCRTNAGSFRLPRTGCG